jgi:FtsH-binding integral membrane protein
MGCLAGLAFQMGFLVGPAIHLLVNVYPELILQAVLYTATAFTCFSLISLYSKRRSFLFVGGIIMSLLQGMLMYRLTGWLFGWKTYNLAYLMFGLLIGCLYIIYDTQMIVERAERGDSDVITHTMVLFVDLFELFIRILQILIELQKQEENKKKKDRK